MKIMLLGLGLALSHFIGETEDRSAAQLLPNPEHSGCCGIYHRISDKAPDQPTTPPPASEMPRDRLCVRNSDSTRYYFAVETIEGGRHTQYLSPGEELCTSGTPGAIGTVSVFEGPEVQEGCSRRIAVGQREEMLRYVDFDRCFWTSNT